jgi:4-amino-4-deoxy-L-arabinose transferase-like glycosyltransferase
LPRPLALILVLAALESVAWDLATPAFQGPDEDAQFAYLQYFAETGNIPSSTTGAAPNSTEEQTALIWLNLFPLRGDLNAKPAWSSADLAAWHRIERAMPTGSRANGAGPNPQAVNPPLYYALMAIPYRLFIWLPLLKRLFLLRLISALCFLGTIALTWKLAGELFRRVRWKQTLAAGVVALQPKLASMSGVISADNLLVLTVTGFLLAAVRLVQRGPSRGRVLAASVLAVAAVLTQARGLVTLPVLAVALAVAWVRHRPPARERMLWAGAAVATIACALGAYALFAKANNGSSLFGGEVTQINSGHFSLSQFLSSVYQFYFQPLPGLQPRVGPAYGYQQVFIETFYGGYGWLEVNLPDRIDAALQVLSAVGLVGLYTACIVGWRRLRRSWPPVVVMLALLVTSLGFLHYVSYRALLGNGGSDPLITGRYLLPMISLFALAIVFTVSSLPRRAGPLAGAVVLAIGVLLSLDAIGITMARFYA